MPPRRSRSPARAARPGRKTTAPEIPAQEFSAPSETLSVAPSTSLQGHRCVVTGSSGHLGKSLVTELARQGADVVALDVAVPRSQVPGVSYVTADLTDRDATAAAIKGAETVFHCAAVIDLCPFPTDSIIAVNIGGTENVVSGCKCHGVGNLVYVSSVDTVFDGAPKVNADESTPYPRHPFSYNGYIGTKVAGEQIVGFCLPHPKHLPVLAHASDGPTSDRVMPAMATGLATECLHCSQVASSLTVCSVNRYWLPTVQSYGRQRSGPPTSQDLVIS